MDDNPELFPEENKNNRSVSVDLTDNTLMIDISDAVSEKDKVKFTVHTKVGTSLSCVSNGAMSLNFSISMFIKKFFRFLNSSVVEVLVAVFWSGIISGAVYCSTFVRLTQCVNFVRLLR